MKKKITLAIVLAFALSLCCMVFAACDKGNDVAITWDINSHVTVTADGYKTLPDAVKSGTEFTFTVTPETGWAVSTVTPTNSVSKQSDGTYKVTANRDMTIKVNAREIISDLEVEEINPVYAGKKIAEGDLKVTAKFATSREEELDFEDYTVEYQDYAEAPTLGDTAYYVIYGDFEKTVSHADDPIKGVIRLDLDGGEFAPADLAALEAKPGYSHVANTSVYSYTFSEAFADDEALPTPTKTVNGAQFDFVRWSGVEDNTIAKDTAVSVNAVALFDTKLVEIEKLELTMREFDVTGGTGTEEAPALVITGKFIGATEAYLFLYEGNSDVELKGTTVAKAADTDVFELVYDLRELALHRDTWDYNGTHHENETFESMWMDIKFCAKVGTRTETQEINLKNYANDFVDTSDKLTCKIENAGYSFGYEVHTPNAGDSIAGTTGATYLGTEKLLKLRFDTVDYNLTDVKMQVVDFGTAEAANNQPAIVFTGMSYSATTEAEARAFAEAFIYDMMNFSWAGITDFAKKVTVKQDLSFELAIAVDKIGFDRPYFMHTYKMSGTDRVNLKVPQAIVSASSVTINSGHTTYSITNFAEGMTDYVSWADGLLVITATDDREFAVSNAYLAVEGTGEEAKLYYVVEYSFDGYTAAELEAAFFTGKTINFDLQYNGGDWARNKAAATYDISDGKVTVKMDISSITTAGNYITHFSIDGASGDGSDFKPAIAHFTKNYEFKGKLYSLIYDGDSNFGCVGIALSDNASAVTLGSSQYKIVEEGGKAYFVFNGIWAGSKTEAELKAAISIDFELDGDSTNKTVIDNAKITVTVNEDKSFTVKAEVPELGAGKYWTHLIVDGNSTDVVATGTDATVDKVTYKYIEENRGTWTARLLEVTVAE